MNINSIANSLWNRYEGLQEVPYKIIQYLMINNENIWKLLKYNEPNALSNPSLTLNEKAALIWDGNGDSESYKVFRTPYLDDMFTEQTTQLRVYLTTVYPDNSKEGRISIQFQILTHVKLANIDNNLNRVEVMVEEILKTLNGVDVGGIGVLAFDRKNSFYDIAAQEIWNNRNFYGFRIIMQTTFSSFKNDSC